MSEIRAHIESKKHQRKRFKSGRKQRKMECRRGTNCTPTGLVRGLTNQERRLLEEMLMRPEQSDLEDVRTLDGCLPARRGGYNGRLEVGL